MSLCKYVWAPHSSHGRAIYDSLTDRVDGLTDSESEAIGFGQIMVDIRKDVLRTDRTHPHFSAEDSPALQSLTRILTAYALCNPSLGYAQGMSDLLSPILWIMQDEVDAYWCFSTLMSKMDRLFIGGGTEGIMEKLKQVSMLAHW